jgi:hypothetical protein
VQQTIEVPCPQCNQHLRVRVGNKKGEITCPSCKATFKWTPRSVAAVTHEKTAEIREAFLAAVLSRRVAGVLLLLGAPLVAMILFFILQSRPSSKNPDLALVHACVMTLFSGAAAWGVAGSGIAVLRRRAVGRPLGWAAFWLGLFTADLFLPPLIGVCDSPTSASDARCALRSPMPSASEPPALFIHPTPSKTPRASPNAPSTAREPEPTEAAKPAEAPKLRPTQLLTPIPAPRVAPPDPQDTVDRMQPMASAPIDLPSTSPATPIESPADSAVPDTKPT